MADTTAPRCAKCNGTAFGLQLMQPANAVSKIYLVHCVECGTPIGAMQHQDAWPLMRKQAERLDRIEEQLSLLRQSMQKMTDAIKPGSR